MKPDYDAIIIGAGIIGCCTAFEMSKLGYRTLNIDKLPAAGMGSTAGSCAIIRLHYSTAQGVTLAREGYYYWLDWPKYLETGDPEGMAYYRNTGALVIKTEINKNLAHVKKALQALSVGFLELAPEQVHTYLPNADLNSYFPQKWITDPEFGKPSGKNIPGAIWVPESGYISDPKLSTNNAQVAAEKKGAEFLFNAQVTEILIENNRATGVILSDGRKITAPVVVNVAGPHSFQINAMAGVADKMNIKTRPMKQEVAHIPAPKDLDWERDGFMLSDGDIGCYSRPEVGNHFLIGSEDPPSDPQLWVDDPDDYDQNFTDQYRCMVLREAMRVNGLPIPNKYQGLVDLYDVSDDWLPIYDKSDLPGFYMAVGTSGNQYKNAPVAGAMMAHLIQACEKGLDHDKSPFQFDLKYLKRPLDVGFFSRNREINKDSSFSVIG
ncbi:MAG: FAD-binding oxidoreductase [Desulfotignum sp.]|nr:FAD-binding oxidoreductase [Desulfotignum sp.]MCF8086996.1 FAD-binding oxidoreductase [Desulfotignum sp.]MCF8137170.1 FAD-binding oxidoreductase [Desulfotignum sp.]